MPAQPDRFVADSKKLSDAYSNDSLSFFATLVSVYQGTPNVFQWENKPTLYMFWVMGRQTVGCLSISERTRSACWLTLILSNKTDQDNGIVNVKDQQILILRFLVYKCIRIWNNFWKITKKNSTIDLSTQNSVVSCIDKYFLKSVRMICFVHRKHSCRNQ